MMAEFGQAPMSLKLDLNTYEDSPTHIAAFRRRSGWLMMAKATIQSEEHLLSEKLIVACFDHGEPIPSWRAVHLTQCQWHDLEECGEEPPELLDDLLCEQEGALYLRWQRETNRELAELHDRTERQLEILEARTRKRLRLIDRQIAELRRRRRHPDASPEERLALSAIIEELDAESEGVTTGLIERRRKILSRSEAAEESMWQREDILFEVEPLCVIQWRAGKLRLERSAAPVWREGQFYSTPRAFQKGEIEDEATVLAKVQEAMTKKAHQQRADAAPLPPIKVARPQDLPKASPLRRKLLGEAIPVRGVRRDTKLVPVKQAPLRDTLRVTSPPPAPPEERLGPLPKPTIGQLPLPHIGEDLQAKRAALQAELEALEIRGRKFLPGSPKTHRNQMERAEVARQIAMLDHRIAKLVPETEGNPAADGAGNWTPERVSVLKTMWLDGHSANQIAAVLGGTSRNAVIGKAKRLGLPFNYGKKDETA